MIVVLVGVLALIAAATASLFARDALAAAEHRAEVPAVLQDELAGSSADPEAVAGSSGPRTENSPRDERDPSARPVVPFTPGHIFIPDAGVNTTVDPRPATREYNAFIGDAVLTFPVPDGPFTTVWWSEGPRPGEDGLSVILGHARSPRAAVFNSLPDLDEGASLALTGRTDRDEDVVARYRIEQVVSGISKSDATALRDVLDNPPDGATLALITCSGTINEVLSSRSDNTVVFASLVGMHTDT